jgi:hypothetical protein
MLGRPAQTFIDCVDRIPGTPLHGPAYGLPCMHPDCQGITWTRTVPTPATIRSERDLLTRQLEWIARQDWAGAFYAQIRELRDQLMASSGRSTSSTPPRAAKGPPIRRGGRRLSSATGTRPTAGQPRASLPAWR